MAFAACSAVTRAPVIFWRCAVDGNSGGDHRQQDTALSIGASKDAAQDAQQDADDDQDAAQDAADDQDDGGWDDSDSMDA